MPRAAARMDLEVIIVKEGRQKDSYDITYMWKLKYDTNELIYKLETSSQTGEGGIGSLGLTDTNFCI